MKDVLVPIDQAGRIVLPKTVREELAVKAGDVFKVSIEGDAVTLKPDRKKAGFVRKGKALVFCGGGQKVATSEINRYLEADRDERVGEFTRARVRRQ